MEKFEGVMRFFKEYRYNKNVYPVIALVSLISLVTLTVRTDFGEENFNAWLYAL